MGRADQTTKVKGMFVQPSQVAEIARRHKGNPETRLVVDNSGGIDRMTLQCEIHDTPPAGLAQAIEERHRSVTSCGRSRVQKPGEPAERRQGDRGRDRSMNRELR